MGNGGPAIHPIEDGGAVVFCDQFIFIKTNHLIIALMKARNEDKYALAS